MNLNGKKVIITGASSGIGEEILKQLLNYDVDVIAANRNITRTPLVSDRVEWMACDVSKQESIDELFARAVEKWGSVDLFIANAGFAYYEKIIHQGDDAQDHWTKTNTIFATNVIAPVYSLTKMAELNSSRHYMMVMTASAMAELPIPGYARYSATKAAVDAFSYAYQHEKDDQGHLCVVYPIATRTKFFESAASGTPVPWPSQTADKVGEAVIDGILKDKTRVYPSKVFLTMMWINRLLPFAFPIYAKIEGLKFKRWYRRQVQRA